jgi:hypothetical protein
MDLPCLVGLCLVVAKIINAGQCLSYVLIIVLEIYPLVRRRQNFAATSPRIHILLESNIAGYLISNYLPTYLGRYFVVSVTSS